jgi:hypothetical protein
MEQIEFIRAEAALAAAEAAKAVDPKLRQHWQKLAEAWRGLAVKPAGPPRPSRGADNQRS